MRGEGMFRDEAVLRAAGGRGGDGACSFHREKYRPFGGPDGGDGGDGGSVVLEAVPHENSLFRVARLREVRAEAGRPGAGGHRTGRRGRDRVVEVPVGTQVLDLERGNLLADLDRPGARLVLARGGRGGRGNARFATAVDQAPRRWEPGGEPEERAVRLVLKLVADLGLVGLPNAGKSTLLRRISAARPRVGDWPFTTLDPNLGMVETGADPPVVVVADLPGLIEGAHEGRGLGLRFLRHAERTRALLHLVDCSATARDPLEAFRAVRSEIEEYSEELAARPWLPVATKVEDAESEARARAWFDALGREGIALSAVTGRGIAGLLRALPSLVRTGSAADGASP